MKRLTMIFVLLQFFYSLSAAAQPVRGIDVVALRKVQSQIDTSARNFLDTIVAHSSFSLFKNKNADGAFNRFGTIVRCEEFGLQHGYFAGYGKGDWNVYAMNDTIIALTFVFKQQNVEQSQLVLYNQTMWKQWYARIDSLYGNVDTLAIDSISRSDYETLTSTSSYYRFGEMCGYLGPAPTGYCAAWRLFSRGDINTLRRVLRGPNLEGRLYALTALKSLDGRRDIEVPERLYLFERELSYLPGAGTVALCTGCIMNRGTVSDALAKGVNFMNLNGRCSEE